MGISGAPAEEQPTAPAPASGRPGSFGYHTERRSRPSKVLPQCRICWKPLTVADLEIEEGDRYPYLRCPSCGHSFPIRHTDVGE
jgi:DNA-directed RNA polymerase subunit RPC12/RpoP